MPRLRQNIITGEWVIIAPERAKRPEDFIIPKPKRAALDKGCPFCHGGDGYIAAIPRDQTANIYATPNKFPAFTSKPTDETVQDVGIYKSRPSLGGHEVIVIADHFRDIAHLTSEQLEELFWVYQRRYLHYENDPNVAYTMLIHNHGPEAGATIHHPHSQLFASSIVPNYIKRELEGSKQYFIDHDSCVFCDIVKEEKKQRIRIIDENEDFLVFTWFAARFPFETWILPTQHLPYYKDLTANQRHNLARILKKIITRLDVSLYDPPFNYYIHTTPHRKPEHALYYHWHIEIAPRVSKFGGFELGSATIIDVVSPERAAEFLKKIIQ